MKEEKDNFGKEIKLPSFAPAPLDETSKIFQRLQYLWWGHQKIAPLKSDNALMRQKVTTLDLFRGKKKWDPARIFTADYMDVKTNLHQAQFHQAIQLLFSKGGDQHIYFADAAIKVNRRGASQIQVIVVTDQHIYKYEPKKYKMIKSGTPVNAIKALHLCLGPDTFLIVEMDPPHRDMVLDLGTNNCERYSELATILYQHRKQLGKAPEVTFDKTIKFNNSRTIDNPGQEITLTFEPHAKPTPGCKFKGPSKGTAMVHYDPDYLPHHS